MTLASLRPWSRWDLHLHSNLSDGRCSPQQVLERAAKGCLDVIALTDHDLPCGLPHGPVEVRGHPLYVLHGVEISGHFQGEELHLLVYFDREMPKEFAHFCRTLARARAERYERARLNLALEGLAPADAACWSGERAITRLHLSQALVDAGHAETLQDAFDRFVGRKHGRVPTVTLPFVDAIRVARAHGGIPCWAHPRIEHARAWTAGLVAAGLQGLEVYRPVVSKKQRKELTALARKHGLLMTGGSDWHGWRPEPLGAFSIEGQRARPLTEALAA